MNLQFKPHVYQEYAIKRILDNDIAVLMLDMGLGKTISSLTAISAELYDKLRTYNILVIAPYRVAESTWTDEIEKWAHTGHLTTSIVMGSPKKRLAALKTEADIHIINVENIKWLYEHYKTKWPFDFVIIDELSMFKSRSSQRFKALRKVRPKIKKIVGLTGTPTPNGLLDLWSQIYLMDGGERLGKTFGGFRDRYFLPGHIGRDSHGRTCVFSYVPRVEAEKAIYAKLADICISMKAKDWLDMPERVDNIKKVHLTKKAKQAYLEMEKEYILEYAEGDIEAVNAAALANKLLQIANGAVYDENRNVRIIHDQKLEALEDIVLESNGKPVLVFYAYKHDLARILEKFPDAEKYDGDDQKKRWNRGEIPMLVLHPKSAGHGLNLQYGGSTVVWFGLNWSLELYQQANARLHRQGQKQTVIVHHIVCEGTNDEDVMASLASKDRTQETFLKAMKARVRRVLEG